MVLTIFFLKLFTWYLCMRKYPNFCIVEFLDGPSCVFWQQIFFVSLIIKHICIFYVEITYFVLPLELLAFIFMTCKQLPIELSTTVGRAVSCMPIMQQAPVQSPVGTSFLGEVFSRFFLTCKTNVCSCNVELLLKL